MFDRCTVRLRSELQAELQKSSIKSETDHQQARQQLEGSLSQEIESHTCPICYELMVAPRNAPILLFPCGMFSCHLDEHLMNNAFLSVRHLLLHDKCMIVQGIPFVVCASRRTLSGTKSACVLAVEKSYSHRSGSLALLAHSAVTYHARMTIAVACIQAPNVSLQQLIASFAAQGRQLGLHPAPRKAIVTASSDTSMPQGASPDTDQITSCRYGMGKLQLLVTSDSSAFQKSEAITHKRYSRALIQHATQQYGYASIPLMAHKQSGVCMLKCTCVIVL